MSEHTIHNKSYILKYDEFPIIEPELWEPLQVRKDLSQTDREIYLINKLARKDLPFTNYGTSHNNYVFKNVDTQNKYFLINNNNRTELQGVLRMDLDKDTIPYRELFIIGTLADTPTEYKKYKFGERHLYVHNSTSLKKYNIEHNDDEITDNNLIHLLLMIKDSGDIIKQVISENIKYCDKITILDTGSTDNTIEKVREAVQEHNFKNCIIFSEPFVDFKVSRNRLLDLSTKMWELDEDELHSLKNIMPINSKDKELTLTIFPEYCFNIMLDDTYILQGKVKETLTKLRSDDGAESFSATIKSTDTIYDSCRITKPHKNLKYKYRVHEVIDSLSHRITPEHFFINDISSEYMVTRTRERKEKDLEFLFKDLEEYQDDPRIMYYIGDTYYGMKDWENAHKYYMERWNHKNEGFHDEKFSSLYRATFIGHTYLEKNISETIQQYIECYEYDSNRPEPFFMLGNIYQSQSKMQTAHHYYKSALDIQPKMFTNNNFIKQYYLFLPLQLLITSVVLFDIEYGKKAIERYRVMYKDETLITNYEKIFNELEKFFKTPEKPKTQLKNRESIIILTRNEKIKKFKFLCEVFLDKLKDKYNIVLFNTEMETPDYIIRKPLDDYIDFIKTYKVYTCVVISDYEFINVINASEIKNLSIIYEGEELEHKIITGQKINEIVCMKEKYKKNFLTYFSDYEDKIKII